jgi:hypothetical protein
LLQLRGEQKQKNRPGGTMERQASAERDGEVG